MQPHKNEINNVCALLNKMQVLYRFFSTQAGRRYYAVDSLKSDMISCHLIRFRLKKKQTGYHVQQSRISFIDKLRDKLMIETIVAGCSGSRTTSRRDFKPKGLQAEN